MNPHHIARGTRKAGNGRISKNYLFTRVGFDDEAFLAIRLMAATGGVSFSEQVRILVEWGRESAENAKQALWSKR